MENKSITIIIALVLIAGIGYFVFSKKQAEVANYSEPAPTATTSTSTSSAPSGIALSIVATHNSRSSCWTTINGGVYDLTGWIPNHPGGEAAILSLCGTDGTAKFTTKHGRDAKPQTVLAGFKIGLLAN